MADASEDYFYTTDAEIERDINALDGKGQVMNDAVKRLITNGIVAKAHIHSSLLNKKLSIRHKKLLIVILGFIGDDESITPIINAANHHLDEVSFMVSVIGSVDRLSRNVESGDFVYSLLQKEGANQKIIRSGLVYLTNHPEKGDKKWAETFASNQFDTATRSLAFYLGGILGVDGFKERIIAELRARHGRSDELYLLMGLSALTVPDELVGIIKEESMRLKPDNIRAAINRYYFYSGDNEQKKKSATEVLYDGPHFMKRLAVNYLIDNNDASAISHAWLNNDKLVKYMVRLSGNTVVVDESGAKFIKLSTLKGTDIVDSGDTISIQTEEDLFKKIISSFIDNDKKKFSDTALFDQGGLARYLAGLLPPHKRNSNEYIRYKESLVKSRDAILKSWDAVFKIGEDSGIDWRSAKYIASNFTKTSAVNTSLLIGSRGHYYKITIPRLMKFEDKWILADALGWAGEIMRNGEALVWSDRAKKNNHLIASEELKLLNNTSKSGLIPILRMRVTYGEPATQYELFKQLLSSQSASDRKEAHTWLTKAASNNYPKAQFDLSEYLMSEYYANKSAALLTEARNYLQLSADNKYILALNKIAECHASGIGGFDYDISKAISYYQAFVHLDVGSLSKDEKNAYKFFERDVIDKITTLQLKLEKLRANDQEFLTAEALHLLASNFLATEEQGFRMLKTAVDGGYPEAQYQLGLIYLIGNNVASKDVQHAVSLWSLAVAKGHVIATKELAYGYIHGKYGISPDVHKALKLSDKLAAHFISHPSNDYYERDSARIWSVHACDLEMEISMRNDPSFVIPRVKTGRCKGL